VGKQSHLLPPVMHKTPTFISIIHYIRLIWIKTAILCEQLVCIFVSAALLRSSIFTINKINTRKIKRERFGFFFKTKKSLVSLPTLPIYP